MPNTTGFLWALIFFFSASQANAQGEALTTKPAEDMPRATSPLIIKDPTCQQDDFRETLGAAAVPEYFYGTQQLSALAATPSAMAALFPFAHKFQVQRLKGNMQKSHINIPTAVSNQKTVDFAQALQCTAKGSQHWLAYTCSDEHPMQVIDLKTESLLAFAPWNTKHTRPLAAHNDLLLTRRDHYTLEIHHLKARTLTTIDLDSDDLSALDVSDKYVALQSAGYISVWRLTDGQLIHRFKPRYNGFMSGLKIAGETLISTTGEFLVSDSGYTEGKAMESWNLSTGKPLKTRNISYFAYVPHIISFQGQKMVTYGAGEGQELVIWDKNTWTADQVFRGKQVFEHPAYLTMMQEKERQLAHTQKVTPQGHFYRYHFGKGSNANTFVSAGHTQILDLWNIKEKKHLYSIPHLNEWITAAEITDQYLILGDFSGNILTYPQQTQATHSGALPLGKPQHNKVFSNPVSTIASSGSLQFLTTRYGCLRIRTPKRQQDYRMNLALQQFQIHPLDPSVFLMSSDPPRLSERDPWEYEIHVFGIDRSLETPSHLKTFHADSPAFAVQGDGLWFSQNGEIRQAKIPNKTGEKR